MNYFRSNNLSLKYPVADIQGLEYLSLWQRVHSIFVIGRKNIIFYPVFGINKKVFAR